MKSDLRRTWAEIDLDALLENYKKLRQRIGDGVKFLGVVKADAYGHGSVMVSKTLEDAGFEGYIVGGCVRDAVMGNEPHDWDITTSARPEEVKAVFKRTVDTGIQHGTVTVMVKDKGYEMNNKNGKRNYGNSNS